MTASKPAHSARARAARLLNRIEVGGAFVGVLDDDESAPPGAARQVTDYVAGVTRLRRRLDFWIRRFYRGDYDRMEPILRQILRIGVYDLTERSTPPHAAVYEAVALARTLVRPAAGKLVNGILRALVRAGEALPTPDTGDSVRDLAILGSHPTWMVRRWVRRYGEDATRALIAWNNARPHHALRHAPEADVAGMLGPLGVAWEPSAWLDDFVRVRSLQPVLAAGLVAGGTLVVQDESTGLVVRMLDPRPGETVLDLCAAPGGKARYAAARMKGQGHILAVDVSASRMNLLAGVTGPDTIIEPRVADARSLPEEADIPVADRVLLDAPCSGLGVLAKRADLRWRRTLEDLAELTRLQDELLDAAAMLVCPGGLLVYSTCTIEPEENEERIRDFLKRHPEYRVERPGPEVPPGLLTPEGFLHTLPFRDRVDGAFCARLRRAEA